MGVWIYPVILIAKIIEVSLATVRTVLITKGERNVGAIIGLFEITIWMVLASSVLTGLMQDPLKAVFYALGFALGNFFGSLLEEKIGLGLSEIIAIVKQEDGEELAEHLRDENYAVTVVNGDGRHESRHILFLFTQRKKVREAVRLIKSRQPDAVITVSDTKPLYGGYGLLRK